MTKPASRIPQPDIDRANAVSLADIAAERGLVLKKSGHESAGPCPHCGGDDRFSVNTAKHVFNCRGCGHGDRGAISFVMWLDDVGFREAVATLIGERSAPVKSQNSWNMAAKKTAADDAYERRQRDKARWLWSQRLPITGTIAESYLRSRAITCALPPTLAFLPARKPGHHPAMIAAFGLRKVVAVHLTLLKTDGSGKIEVEKPKSNKLMIGSPSGLPIIISPPTDTLVICEGIENALTLHQVLGLGAWAAGSAPHMAKLADAVPDGIGRIEIIADPDPEGERSAARLAEQLDARSIFAEVLSL